MLAGIGKIWSGARSLYNDLNPATLTGAIDVVVVEQQDGSYVSSPFHVRFGKLGVLSSRQKVVYIEINGEPTELQMKLGPAGEAFFVHGIAEQWEGPEYMATSPIPSSPIAEATQLRSTKSECEINVKVPKKSSMKRVRTETELSNSSSSSASDLNAAARTAAEHSFRPISQQDDELLESGGMFPLDDDEEGKDAVPDIHNGLSKAISLPVLQESSRSRTESWAINTCRKSTHVHPFSDTDITPLVSPVGSRPHTPKSDTEAEIADRKELTEPEPLAQWKWGQLPDSTQQLIPQNIVSQAEETVNTQDKSEKDTRLFGFLRSAKKMKPDNEGVSLDNLSLLDPESAAAYLIPHKSFNETSKSQDVVTAEKPGHTHVVNMPAHTHVVNMPADELEDAESGNGASLPMSPDNLSLGHRNIPSPTSESGTMRDHECALFGDIAMSMCGSLIENYSNVSTETFEKHLITFSTFSEKPLETLQNTELVLRVGGKYYNWIAAGPMILSMMVFHQMLPEDTQQSLVRNAMSKKQKASARSSSWWPFGAKAKDVESGAAASINSTPSGSPRKTAVTSAPPEKHSESGDEADDEKEKPTTTDHPTVDTLVTGTLTDPIDVPAEKHYVKTLRLTSEELERLKLHQGENEIEFSVTTAYQGTTRCAAHIYLWKHTDKIVISDIDGTITKSDVLGQLMPIIGRDWSQLGVTDLYTKIANNGYKFAYLSARAIGQAQITRDYLKSVKQGNLTLPPGPVFLNPSSLINAFHKEVIEKKPEEFKISCMSDIKSLFSSENSLYAGFGNRVNDIYAYRAVGIPKCRIFLIDPSGKVKSDFSETFQSSYTHLSDVTDHYFPPLEEVDGESAFHAPTLYSDFTYWREPMPDISLELPE